MEKLSNELIMELVATSSRISEIYETTGFISFGTEPNQIFLTADCFKKTFTNYKTLPYDVRYNKIFTASLQVEFFALEEK